MPCSRSRRSTGSPPRHTPSSSRARPTGNAPAPGVVPLTVQKARPMLDDTFGWSHARGNEVVPSPWQATIDVAVRAEHQATLARDGATVWRGRKFWTRPADLERLWADLDLPDPAELTVVVEPN